MTDIVEVPLNEYQDEDGYSYKYKFEFLRQQLAGFLHVDDLRKAMIATADENAELKKQLAECQAREKVRLDLMKCGCWMDAQAVPSGSIALDEAIKQAKQEALLEAAKFYDIANKPVADRLHSMAGELK